MAEPLASLYSFIPKRGFVSPASSGQSDNPATTEVPFLSLDCLVNEAPNFSFEPTKSALEDGSEASDHVITRPAKLAVTAIITDTPLQYSNVVASAFFNGPSPSQQAYSWLKGLAQNKIPFDFVGSLDVYKNMVITSFDPVRNAKTGDALRFNCEMSQIIVISDQILLKPTSKKINQAPTSHGGQPLKPVSSTTSTSVLNSIYSGTYQDTTPTAGVTATPTVIGAAF
jgi:hypothetical protein